MSTWAKKLLVEYEHHTDDHGITWNDEGDGIDGAGNLYQMQHGKIVKIGKPSRLSNQPTKKYYHRVSFAQKDQAKAEGLRWDPEKKMWYHTSELNSRKSKFAPA